jgi:alkylhydroperoxidase/carboxymuconolactone decarboxylase family protein YurZ
VASNNKGEIMKNESKVSEAFMSFAKNVPEHQKIWMETVQRLSNVSKLDNKTDELSYIAVLAALRLESGIPFHVKHSKMLGASRDEIISAVFVWFTCCRKCCDAINPNRGTSI